MRGSMVDIQSATAEMRRGKTKKKKKQDKNIMSASVTQGGHKILDIMKLTMKILERRINQKCGSMSNVVAALLNIGGALC